jgi:GT2 family glycosyltransferase/2-polyprenyl-3-methyl-5-hydroxy-6-metoxy-1,4-benzoquinol methylase/glycosyltransferase involved in cell wall biosynthesis
MLNAFGSIGAMTVDETQKHENGYCIVCGCHSSFRFDATIITPQLQKAWGISDNVVEAFNRKESTFCSSCGSSLRIRRLGAVLMQTFAEISGISSKSFVELLRNEKFRRLRIAEINACGALHSYLEDHPNLHYSEWLSDAKTGEVHDGVRCEDLQCLTYPDNYFDIILTSETLEHVPDPDKAWREIYRTLKGGGFHIFTIPIVPWQRETIKRARVGGGRREDLLEPAYHSPWGRQDVFVYTDFGMDVVEKLNAIGLNTEVFYRSPETDLDVAMVFRSHKTGGHVEVGVKGVSPMLEWTGERYLPWLEEAAIGYEHLHRYAYATQFVQNKRVLDLACGEGYGSYFLAKNAESVVGIDIDERAIKHARNKYIKQNLEFKIGSITDVPIAGKHLFDVAVCFEALEHIAEHQKLLSEVKRLLTPDGIFIVSTPNKKVYTDEPQFNNPFHVHELYFDEFRDLFEKYFKNVKFLGQRIYCNSNIWPVFPGADNKVVEYLIDRNPKEFVLIENDKRIPLYFIAIASDADRDIEEAGSALIDVSDALVKQKDGQIAAHTKEQERLTRDIGQLSATVEAQQQRLVEKDEHASRVAEDRDRLVRDVTELQSALSAQQQALVEKDEQANRIAKDRDRLVGDVTELQAIMQAQRQVIAEKELGSKQFVAERDRLSQKEAQLQVMIDGQLQALRQKEQEIEQLAGQREALTGEVEALKDERRASMNQLTQVRSAADARQKELMAIRDSLAWLCITRYRHGRDRLFPSGTSRRKAYETLKNFLKDLVQLGPRGLSKKAWEAIWLSRLLQVWARKAYISIPLSSLTPNSRVSDHPDVNTAIHWIPSVKIGGIVKRGFFMHPPASVSYRFKVPPKAVFCGFTGLMPDVWGRNPGGVNFEISAVSELNGRQLIEKRIFVHPTRFSRHRHWRKLRVSLRRFANQDIKLILSTLVPTRATADFASAVWGEPVIRARKSFHHLRTRAKYHFKLLGFRGLVSKALKDEYSSNAAESNFGTADTLQPTEAISVAVQQQTEFRQSLEKNWKTELESFVSDTTRSLVFPSFERPLVSIVIPTFNKAEYLYQCLNNLLSYTDVPYRVIVVDDCSEDLTTKLLNKVLRIDIIKNEQNLDFIRTCNKGASFARGQYILFLNNDVVVSPRWLSVLVRTIEEISNCAAVGAKLVHPNETLQEAGSIVWQDGSAMGYGRDDDPLKPEYCYLREVDYCSAACLLVRADVFRNLDGFDESYLPAYYEDSDLCFAIREQGYKVYYQPQATVFHYEFGSRSFERAKALMEANQQKFVQKWGKLMLQQYPYGSVLKARDRRKGKRILVIDDQIPAPHLGSGFPRAHKLLELLSELGFVVTFMPADNQMAHQPTTQRLQQLGVEVFYGSFILEDVLRGRAGAYDVIIVSRPHNGARYLRLVRECFPAAVIIYDAEALFCLREFLRAEVEGRSFSETERRRMLSDELSIAREADVVITVSEAEREIILRENSHNNVVVWGHTHDLYESCTLFSQRKDLLFVGGFMNGHPPNTDAVLHFVAKIFPEIRQRLPGCRLIIVGSDPPEHIQKLSSQDILVTGFVENIDEYYEKCRVFVAPLRFGAGINYKLTEAMSYGTPAVVSPLAAAGLSIIDGQEALVAADDREFTEKVVQLYKDEALWIRVQQTAENYALDHFSPETMKIRLLDILDSSRKAEEKEIVVDSSSVGKTRDTECPNDATDRTWSTVAQDKAGQQNWKLLSWDGHPCIERYINRRISGDPSESWLQFVKRRFCPETLYYGLSLGCGWGSLERDAVRLGVSERFDAYDVASGAIETAKAEATKQGLQDRIRYFCADLNRLVLQCDRYDICFAAASLHHVHNLEHVLQQVHAALHRDGLFIVLEYVGPSRFQWNEEVHRLMNKFLSLLPESLRRDVKDGTTVKVEAIRPSIEDVIRVDPTEAVRSEEILTQLEQNFEILYRADFGGTLLQFALANIVGNFRDNDPKDTALLEMVSLFEETLIDKEVIPSDFVFLVCRPSPGVNAV